MITKTYIAISRSILILAAVFAAQAVSAQDDVEQGRLLAYTCMGCHGIDGYRNAYPSYRVPKLGGQKGAYIKAALIAYRDGQRPHPTMQAQGGSLSDADIDNLTAWFEALQPPASDNLDGDDVAGFAPATLCVTCHGVAGTGVAPQPPVLSGQHEDYLVHALQQYRDGKRTGNIMAAFAATLSDSDIATLAAFYAKQGGLFTPEKDQ
ncbi:MAG: cytochrome c [Gammaproteobacteria bacterium]|nr:cytochrome c [Gammaproteobacteria bacterium]MDH4315817.1 cytochrome c [Gammaproteobacteria bacterium]MDH5215726.1 cytochrome c [Gammaproteobacteria bacterium]